MKKAILSLSFFVCGAFADNFLLDSLKPVGSHEPMGHEEPKAHGSGATFVDIDPKSEVGQLVHLLLLERQAKIEQQKAAAVKPKPKSKVVLKKKVVKKVDPCEPLKSKEVILESASKEPTVPKDEHAAPSEKSEKVEKKEDAHGDTKKPEPKHEASPEKHEAPKSEKKEAPKHGADAAQTIETDVSAKRLLAANLCN